MGAAGPYWVTAHPVSWLPYEWPVGDDRQISSKDQKVSQVKGQAIAHRHPPVSLIDPDRQEDHAHSQVNEKLVE